MASVARKTRTTTAKHSRNFDGWNLMMEVGFRWFWKIIYLFISFHVDMLVVGVYTWYIHAIYSDCLTGWFTRNFDGFRWFMLRMQAYHGILFEDCGGRPTVFIAFSISWNFHSSTIMPTTANSTVIMGLTHSIQRSEICHWNISLSSWSWRVCMCRNRLGFVSGVSLTFSMTTKNL